MTNGRINYVSFVFQMLETLNGTFLPYAPSPGYLVVTYLLIQRTVRQQESQLKSSCFNRKGKLAKRNLDAK